tara:strand:+ start:1158 stop:1925 length:768 start_codon:yes stop_codon:yes gene_type:complete
MELIYIFLGAISFGVIAGSLARNKNKLTHFIQSVGIALPLVFIGSTLIFFSLIIKEPGAIERTILPTLFGLFLNGLVFSFIFKYFDFRKKSKKILDQLNAINGIIGLTLYDLQLITSAKISSYKKSDIELHKFDIDTAKKLHLHYKEKTFINKLPDSFSYYKVYGGKLKKLVDIYKSILPITFEIDSKLYTEWVNITYFISDFAEMLSNRNLSEFHDPEEGIFLARYCHIQFAEMLTKIIEIESIRLDYINKYNH